VSEKLIPLSEYNRYIAVVNNGLENTDYLNENQEKFLADFKGKFELYTRGAFVSEKQALYFEVIEDQLQRSLGSAYED
jgi:hypothetical protein